MENYQITDLEQLSGIKAHTIRIWEKRYKIIQPHRTKTNIRYYDNEQARRLLNIATLINKGHKISKIAGLSDAQLNKLISDNVPAENNDAFNTTIINALVAATLNYNEEAFEKTYATALNRMGLNKTVLEIIYPFLFKVGILWSVGNAMPAQEHFASGLIRRKLMAGIDGLLVPKRNKKTFVLFLPPDEWHEIALLYSEYIIKNTGSNVINLGQNVPYDNLQTVISSQKPIAIVGFFTAGKSSAEILAPLKNLLNKNKELHILIGASQLNKTHLPKNERVIELNHPQDLLNYLK